MTFDLAHFFKIVRGSKAVPGILGPTLEQGEVDGCEDILKAFAGHKMSWAAYALATAYHETAGTMQPIRERGSRSYFMRLYDVTGKNPARARAMGNTEEGDGALYNGRGFVQLTWKSNYEKARRATGVDLVKNPDLAMTRELAAEIMLNGMVKGWFTGKGLADYMPDVEGSFHQFTQARRIINGTDKAQKIAREAQAFQYALRTAGWST